MLSKDDILTIVSGELSTASLIDDLEDAYSYYLGEPNGTEVEGRSQVTSTDVADAIEWILPQIMKSFTQNNEIVIFDPVHEDDEQQAELESEYVYEVLMKQNDGFIILHQFVKDALMQRNGILKVYYADITKTKVDTWTGITEQQLQQLLAAEGIELLEESKYVDEAATEAKQQQVQFQLQQLQQHPQQQSPQLQQHVIQLQQELQDPVLAYDVRVSVSRTKGQIYIDPIPPEEFKYNGSHNSINLDKARFTSHVTSKTVSDIISEYKLSKEEAEDLPEGSTEYDTAFRFTLTDSSFTDDNDNTIDKSQIKVDIAESFMLMDIDEVGVAKLMKITTVGSDEASELIKVEEVDEMPWVSVTAFLMSHKFQGLSIYDRLKQIQEQKTALIRNVFDNLYLQNNQRHVVIENQVNMDDLLVSRPGGVIRAKTANAVTALQTPVIGQEAYQMIDYLDRVRAGRTGVDAEGGATPQNIGDRVGSQGVDRLMNSKEELVGLIIRVIAETGVKPLCIKIRNESTKHIDSVQDFRFRGMWKKVNPAQWEERTKCTVRVGTGSGNHAAKLTAIQSLMAIQEKIIANPQQSLLDQKQVYTAIDDFCKFSGLNGANRYFIDPDSPTGKDKQKQVDKQNKENTTKQDEMQRAMAQSQMELAKAEQGKAQAQMVSAQAKAQADQAKNELVLQKQTYESQLAAMKQQLEEAKAIADNMGKDQDIRLKKYEIDQKAAIELTKLEAVKDKEENNNFKANQETITNE